jgi:uncharacterized GH25 family protein
MKLHRLLVALLVVLVSAPQLLAHFVFVAIANDSSGRPAAHVWFSELAEPDNAELLDKLAAIKVWSRSKDGAVKDVKVTKQTDASGGGALVGAIPEGAAALSAHINYGVLTRQDQTFLLQYHAKFLEAGSPDLTALTRDEKLTFDIVPHARDKGYTLEVLFQGKPVAGSEVVIFDPAAAETTSKTDEAGKLELDTTKPGLYSIRAKWVVNEAGKLDGKEYPQVNHYSTLTLRVPEAGAASTK